MQESGGVLLITADHGNADHMLEPDGSPNTAHSLNPVPVIVTVPGLTLREGGVLADVAPTILELLGYEQPAAMTGRSLIQSLTTERGLHPRVEAGAANQPANQPVSRCGIARGDR